MCQLITCAKCCTIFSFIGCLYLLIIGALLQRQPKYVKGAYHGTASAPSVYYAAAIYFGFMVLSLVYWGLYEGSSWGLSKMREKDGRKSYDSVEMVSR